MHSSEDLLPPSVRSDYVVDLHNHFITQKYSYLHGIGGDPSDVSVTVEGTIHNKYTGSGIYVRFSDPINIMVKKLSPHPSGVPGLETFMNSPEFWLSRNDPDFLSRLLSLIG